MTKILTIFIAVTIGLLAYLYQHFTTTTMPDQAWSFAAQKGFFSHDDDPESWEFRATTRKGLGLLHRAYPSDAEFDPDGKRSDWERMRQYVSSLNKEDPDKKQYKILCIIRHGEGIHNVKEREVGRQEWDVSVRLSR